jgi:hypothetical protein
MSRQLFSSSIGSAVALLATGLVACAAEPTSSTHISDNLSVVRTADELRGTYESPYGLIDFASSRTDRGAMLDLTVNGATFDIDVDLVDSALTTDGRDVVLTADDKAALNAFADELGGWLAVNQGQPHEMLAAVTADYWSTAPAGFVHEARVARVDVRAVTQAEIDGERAPSVAWSNGDDGIKCIKRGRWYTAVYDRWKNGTKYKKSVKCNADWGKSACGEGDYDCMGRCGSGCDNWWAPSSYTLDCLDHDTCSHNLCATDGADDKHCGDEYKKSEDDWLWGVWEGCDGD